MRHPVLLITLALAVLPGVCLAQMHGGMHGGGQQTMGPGMMGPGMMDCMA